MAEPALKDKVAIVTGASRGIGAAVAELFAREGAHVVLVARTIGGLEEVDDRIKAQGGAATLVPLDLRDDTGIEQLAVSVAERWGRLDVLVGNAAILGSLSPLNHISAEVWAELLLTNVTANWRLLRAFDGLLRAAEAARTIFVTAGVATDIRAYWGGYAVTKAALETMIKTYAAEIAGTNMRANLLSPGPVRTGMRAEAMPGEDPETLATPADVAPLFLELAAKSCTRNGEVVDFNDQ